MKRSLIVLSALAFTSLSAFAGGPEVVVPQPCVSCFDGLYVGASIGTIQTGFKTDQATAYIVDTDVVNPTVRNLAESRTLHAGNVAGSLFLGYSWAINNLWVIGAELWGTVGEQQSTSNSSISAVAPAGTQISVFNNTKVRFNTFTGGVDGHLGVVLGSSTQLFGIVGVGFGQLKFTSDVSYVDTTSAGGPFTDAFTYSRSKSIAQLRLGGGIEQCINPDWSVRATYVYSSFNSSLKGNAFDSIADSAAIGAPVRTLAGATSVKGNQNTLMFGVVFHPHALL